jgi:hypothetical protein
MPGQAGHYELLWRAYGRAMRFVAINKGCVHWKLTSQMKTKLTTWLLIKLKKEHCNKVSCSTRQVICETAFVGSTKFCNVRTFSIITAHYLVWSCTCLVIMHGMNNIKTFVCLPANTCKMLRTRRELLLYYQMRKQSLQKYKKINGRGLI